MKLPYISIEGVGNTPEEKLDSLIKLEPILAWLGYSENREFNDCECSDPYYKHYDAYLETSDDSTNIFYFSMRFNGKCFLASDITGIINYVQNYKG